jgi:hypothetical protein
MENTTSNKTYRLQLLFTIAGKKLGKHPNALSLTIGKFSPKLMMLSFRGAPTLECPSDLKKRTKK